MRACAAFIAVTAGITALTWHGWPSALLLVASVLSTFAMFYLRAATLRGADLPDITTPLVLALATSAGYALAGVISLRRVEHAAKRSGQLDLY